MAIIFDGAAKRIILDSASVTATGLWSSWVDWLAADTNNTRWLPAFKQVGGEDLGNGVSIPPYIFLLNGWRVRPMEANHTLIITGNLFVEGGGVPVVPTLGAYQVNVNYTVPVQAQAINTTGSSGPSASDIANAVLAAAQVTPIEATTQNRVLENGLTEAEILRLMASILMGKVSGAATGTERFRDLADTKDRVVVTTDMTGNRLAVVRDGT